MKQVVRDALELSLSWAEKQADSAWRNLEEAKASISRYQERLERAEREAADLREALSSE